MNIPAPPTHGEHIAWLRREVARLEARCAAAHEQWKRTPKRTTESARHWATYQQAVNEHAHRDADLGHWTRAVAQQPALRDQSIRPGFKTAAAAVQAAPAAEPHWSDGREPGDEADEIPF